MGKTPKASLIAAVFGDAPLSEPSLTENTCLNENAMDSEVENA
jgi:hypothetical protein